MEQLSLRTPPSRLFLGCIILLGILAYANTFNVPFLFDDIPNIVNNPWLRQRAPLTDFLTSDSSAPTAFMSRNRLTGYLTFAVNYKLHGLDVRGYHVVNLSVHILNALFVYWLVILTFQTPFFSSKRCFDVAANNHNELTALFTALLFVAHPIETQAVTYIVQRFASLATLFFLISLVAYVQARLPIKTAASGDHPKSRIPLKVLSYAIALTFALLAMTTKEIAWTLPVVIALYELLFFKGAVVRRISYLVPLLLTMLIIPLNLVRTGKPIEELLRDLSEASRMQTTLSRLDYFFTQLRVIVTYLRLLFFPVNQNLDYDYPVFNSMFNAQVVLSALVLFLLLCTAVYLYFRSESSNLSLRLTAFGIFWFFITLLVESSFLPIVDVIFEHRVYLPSIGFFAAITTTAYFVARTVNDRWSWAGKAITASLIVAVAISAGMTYKRNMVWADAITLWSDVVNKSPKKARGYNNLGLAYVDRTNYNQAVPLFERALELNPKYSDVLVNLGYIYLQLGLHREAIAQYRRAITTNPRFADGYYGLGVVYMQMGNMEEAILQWRQAIILKPLHSEANNNLGNAYLLRGDFREAAARYGAAVESMPLNAEAHYNLAMALEKQGNLKAAIPHYETFLFLAPTAYESKMLEIKRKLERINNTTIERTP